MIHLFNSCYLYPDILFESSVNYVIVGKNYKEYGSNIETSLYHINSSLGECLGRYETFEDMEKDLPSFLSSVDKTVIYADNEQFIKIHCAYLNTQVKNITKEFYLDACKILAVKLKIRNKLFNSVESQNTISALIETLTSLDSFVTDKKFKLAEKWIKDNSGLEWQLANGNTDKVEEIINRYVYSHFGESRIRFLSRKEPKGTWVENPKNFSYETVESMSDLYNEMRKEQIIVADKMILDFYKNKNYEALISNPKFLMLLSGGKITRKNWSDKVDVWLLRYMLMMNKTKLTELGILA